MDFPQLFPNWFLNKCHQLHLQQLANKRHKYIYIYIYISRRFDASVVGNRARVPEDSPEKTELALRRKKGLVPDFILMLQALLL